MSTYTNYASFHHVDTDVMVVDTETITTLNATTGVFSGSMSAASAAISGTLSAGSTSISGSLVASSGNFSGTISSASSSVSGTSSTGTLLTKAVANQIVVQPAGSGNTYSISTLSSVNPVNNTSLMIYDPAVANTSILFGILHRFAATTGPIGLVSSQSGFLFTIANAGSAYAINLPTSGLVVGINYLFIVISALSGAVTIGAGSAIIYGSVVSSDGTAVTGGALSSAVSNIILGTTSGVGDTYEIFCDGTHWFVRGNTSVHGSVTFS